MLPVLHDLFTNILFIVYKYFTFNMYLIFHFHMLQLCAIRLDVQYVSGQKVVQVRQP